MEKATKEASVVLRKMAQVSKKILSTLPLEKKVWSKARLSKQNQIIEDYLKSSEEEHPHHIPMNYDSIVQSLNERLRFIEELQE